MVRMTAKEWTARKNGKKVVPLEDDDAELFVVFLRNSGIRDFSHIPMETRTPYKGVLNKLKKMGVNSGIPDYLITLPTSYTGRKKRKLIFIEMKRRKGGTVSVKQKHWLKVLDDCEGVDAYVAKGLAEAREIVEKYYFNRKKD